MQQAYRGPLEAQEGGVDVVEVVVCCVLAARCIETLVVRIERKLLA
jgi:hypothetical protein